MGTVLLINPGSVHKYLHETQGWTDQLFVWFIRHRYDRRFTLPSHSRCSTVPPITLMCLQRLFEDRGWQTIVVDEQVEAIDFSLDVDLIGITATTTQYDRAVQIASRFRARGMPTVIGGVHASAVPDDCRADFDAVCVGEAEGYLDDLLADLSQGCLQPVYHCLRSVDLDDVPFFRFDLATGKHFPFHAVSFSRGCPFGCDFCSIRATTAKYRTRSVQPVIEHIVETGARDIWFADANLTGNRERARALFRALIPLKIRWFSSVPLDVCLDQDMLDLMAESGCWLVSVGFETLNESALVAAGKRQNRVETYGRAIESLHDRKIAIEGNFVFGFDVDAEHVFERTARFSIDTGIEIPEFFVLTPYPGTPLYRRLCAEGRIVDDAWSHYENVHFDHLPVFEPLRMTRRQLREGCLHADRIAYGVWNSIKRLRKAGTLSPLILMANYIFTRRILQRKDLIPCTRQQPHEVDGLTAPSR